MKLLDWILGREPVAATTGLAAVITAALGVAATFGAAITPEQIAAIGALAAALAGWAARGKVTPVMTPEERRVDRELKGPVTIRDDDGQLGLLLAVMVILVLAMVGLFAVCTDGDENALYAPQNHEECRDEYECGGDGGYSGGPSGGYYEGGKGGSDYDGDGDGNRCRNFCFYGVPYPI